MTEQETSKDVTQSSAAETDFGFRRVRDEEKAPLVRAVFNSVASRKAGSQPLRPNARMRATSLSACSKNACSSALVNARFFGSDSLSCTCTAVFHSCTTCTG